MRQIDNMLVKCVYASQVKSLLWEVDGRIVHIEPKVYNYLRAQFPLPSSFDCTCSQHVTIHLQATQIPLISNNATTAHKLQGSTVESLYVPTWNRSLNWPYVMMSRVQTLDGLFLGKPLNPSDDYSVPLSLTQMLNTFVVKASPQPFLYSKLSC